MSKFARLNAQQIAQIKKRALAGEDQTSLAREYDTSRQLIWYHAMAKPRSRKAKKADERAREALS